VFKNSIFIKIFALILLTSVTTGGSILIFALKERADFAQKIIVHENALLVRSLAQTIKTGYLNQQLPFETLKLISDSKNIVFLWLVQPNGEIYFADDPNLFNRSIKGFNLSQSSQGITTKTVTYPAVKHKVKLIAQPIELELGEAPWSIYLGASLAPAESAKQQTIVFGLLIFIAMTIILATGSFFFSRRLTKPIKKLQKGTLIIGQGKLNHKIKINTGDELEELSRAFNKMTNKLKKARQRDKLVSQMKSEFITIAAHQLRTPLSGIKWTFQMILNGDMGKIDKKQKEFLQKAYQTNEQMIRLVNDLLSVSRIEQGKFGYSFSQENLNKFIKKVVQSHKQRFAKKGLYLKLKLPKEKLEAEIDQNRLRMVLNNLINNAHDYTLKGGVNIKMKKIIKNNKPWAKISIKDTGIGIPEKQIKRLFTKFFRAKNATKKGLGPGGTGLGLYIAQNIIKKHKGEIKVKSQLNKGTTFSFTLPL